VSQCVTMFIINYTTNYKFMSQHSKHIVSKNHKSFLSESVYNDLNIGTKLLDILDNSITSFGRNELKNKLSYCLTNYDDLNKLTQLNYHVKNDVTYQKTM